MAVVEVRQLQLLIVGFMISKCMVTMTTTTTTTTTTMATMTTSDESKNTTPVTSTAPKTPVPPINQTGYWGFPCGSIGQAFCVDLRRGLNALPLNTPTVAWMNRPTRYKARCQLRGVLRVNIPEWATSVTFHMTFRRPTRVSFHIGDTIKSKGLKGYMMKNTKYTAEIISSGQGLTLFASKLAKRRLHFYNPKAFQNALYLTLKPRKLYIDNYINIRAVHTANLFNVTPNNEIYVGLNRVVHTATGSPFRRRKGSGLCHICIYYM